MSDKQPNAKYLKDYQPPAVLVDRIDLTFDLYEDHATVHSRLSCRKNPEIGEPSLPFSCDGRNLELISVSLDGQQLTPEQYLLDKDKLTIPITPDQFEFEVVTRIEPQNNTSLEGLYKSSRMFCTQCEAQGFRKMTYFPDRPDVMAKYTTKIIADKNKYPVLLSNGNPVESGNLDSNRHWVKWEDPFRKPSYLFALVAGDLVNLEDRFVTKSGRPVTLRIFVEKENADKCDHAMACLKQAMKWDEETFGREYDLDIFMIVAVSDFNMGAMENKGLNIFNSSYILAKPETATDSDFEKIQGVIGHEYFHNWTGNRITCRDWFQLSLKEGLTIFRDQEFSGDMTSKTVKRIQDINLLKTIQFLEDSGPMAHAVRPDSYIEINNFYTATIYHKGAELIRMMHTILGKAGFHKGMDLYFDRYDGQAVTTEDFVKCMEDANQADLGQFRLWYTQAGTPEVTVTTRYLPQKQMLALTLTQSCPPTPGQPKKKPFHIPVKIGLIDADGQELSLDLDGGGGAQTDSGFILHLTQSEQQFRFLNVPSNPTLSIFREFSAPVKTVYPMSDQDLVFLLLHDSDEFNRWQASQKLMSRIILDLVKSHQKKHYSTQALSEKVRGSIKAVAVAYEKILLSPTLNKSYIAQLMTLPNESFLADQMAVINIDALHQVRESVKKGIAESLRDTMINVYRTNQQDAAFRTDTESVGKRSIKNLCLDYLMSLDDPEILDTCLEQFQSANNMTDEMKSLACLANKDYPGRKAALDAFYRKWQDDSLVMDIWFTIQATSKLAGLAEIKTLMQHPGFDPKNPNKLRSVIGSFCAGNLVNFHNPDGSGYEFLGDQVEILNKQNPQIAARLLTPLIRWKKFDPERKRKMKSQLTRISQIPDLSHDVFEIVTKSLT